MVDELLIKKPLTYYEEMLLKGYSRRDFMKFASMMAAFIGVENSSIAQVVKALETKKQGTGRLDAFSGMYLL